MTTGKARISHVVMYCFDFEKMFDFYTRVIGFRLSDIGQARGNRICFLTLDPEADHHQLALAGGRKGDPESSALNHVAFRVDTLTELRARHAQLKAAGVAAIDPVSHASWFSVYYRDPENNRMEFFWDTPYYVPQPIIEPLAIELSDDELLQSVIAKYGNDPKFKTIEAWKAEQRDALV